MASDERLTLAQALELELKARHWTQREASDELGVDQSTVGRWIRGLQIPTPNRYALLAEFLHRTKKDVAELAFEAHEQLTASQRIDNVEVRLEEAEAQIRELTAQLAGVLQALQAE